MSHILGPMLIFLLRIVDVPAGTIRVIYMVRGQRLKATLLSFLEASAYIFAVVRVIQDLKDPVNIMAYAAGYAVGTFVGISIEKWIASGWIVARIASPAQARSVANDLRQAHFGVTMLRAEGREGDLDILFIVAPRKRSAELLKIVQEVDPNAFITIDPVAQAIGGYIPYVAATAAVRK